jgi:hypothetical protein
LKNKPAMVCTVVSLLKKVGDIDAAIGLLDDTVCILQSLRFNLLNIRINPILGNVNVRQRYLLFKYFKRECWF